MDIQQLHLTGDDDTLELLRRLSDAADDTGRAEREIVALVIDLLGPRPIAALAAYRRLTCDYLPWMETRLVRRARSAGSSWAGIARVLDRSRQAVHRKFDRPLTVDDSLPPRRLVDAATADIEEARAASADRARRRDLDEAAAQGDVVPW